MPDAIPNPGPVCVIGAGIVGATAALHLLELGVPDVTVIDAGEPLGGTTFAGAGFVARFGADHDRRIGTWSVPLEEHSLAFYRGLHEAGEDIEYARNGNIVLARTDALLDRVTRGIVDHPLASPGTRTLDADGVAGLSSGAVDPAQIVGGVFMPDAIQLTTGRALEAVLRRIEAAGGRVHWRTAATAIRTEDGMVTGVETAAGTIDAARVVLAAGAWTNDLLATAGWRLPLVPTVATRFVTEDVGLAPTTPTFQSLELHLWLRELGGGFSWGGSFAYGRAETLAAEQGVEIPVGRPVVPSLIAAQHAEQDRIAEVFPALRGARTARIDQGMPVYTADGGLYVGEAPTARGLVVLAGDNESGVTHGPGMGRLGAELAARVPTYVDPAPFRLDRFAPDRFPTERDVVAFMGGDRVSGALR